MIGWKVRGGRRWSCLRLLSNKGSQEKRKEFQEKRKGSQGKHKESREKNRGFRENSREFPVRE